MYGRVLTCDFDGTGASEGQLAPELVEAFAGARSRGITTILATGRVLEDLRNGDWNVGVFDAVVAENGAVLWLPHRDLVWTLGTPPPESFLGQLRNRGIPFHCGKVVIGTWAEHFDNVMGLIRKQGLDLLPIFNRDALMLLPSGVDKATGVRRALRELDRSEHNMIAFGDAENDYPLLRLASVGVAPAPSVAGLSEIADVRLSQRGSSGVANYVLELLERDCTTPLPARHQLLLGHDQGEPVQLPARDINVMISGDPHGGKSYLAGLVVERILESGQTTCVIDPEGDHSTFSRSPDVVHLGACLALPRAEAVIGLLRKRLSVVLDLASLSYQEKVAYLAALWPLLDGVRAETGMPHWTIVDEAHYFFHRSLPFRLEGSTGSHLLATYRPSWISPAVQDQIDTHLLTQTTNDDERYFATSVLQALRPLEITPGDALAALRAPDAGLFVNQNGGPPVWRMFRPLRRKLNHVHHARKYSDTRLPDHMAFHFWYTNDHAHNVREFFTTVRTLPAPSLRHHLAAGDFSRWAARSIGDRELARSLRRIENTSAAGGSPGPSEVADAITERYELGDGGS